MTTYFLLWYNVILSNCYPGAYSNLCRNLQSNLQSKCGLIYKSVIYRSVGMIGIQQSRFETSSTKILCNLKLFHKNLSESISAKIDFHQSNATNGNFFFELICNLLFELILRFHFRTNFAISFSN